MRADLSKTGVAGEAGNSRSEILRHFRNGRNSQAVGIARQCERLALEMEEMLAPGPEKSIGLRKLLEAKDCFVRAKLKGTADED